MSFIYSVSDEYNNSKIGKLATPLKVLIEAESDAQRKKGGALTTLFNIEKSNRYGETIQYGDEFTAFSAAAEGTAAEADSLSDTFSKFIEHIPFMKEFVITKQMLDDSVYGIGADAKRRAHTVRCGVEDLFAARIVWQKPVFELCSFQKDHLL